MNKKLHHTGAAVLGLAAMALAAIPAQSASIQVGAFYQESSNKTSSSPPVASACNGVFCYIIFNKVPAGKQFVVTQVSCNLSVSTTTAEVVSMYLGGRKGPAALERFTDLIPGTQKSNQPGYNLVLNSSALQLYTENDRPEIFVGYKDAASTVGFCTIAGQMTDIL